MGIVRDDVDALDAAHAARGGDDVAAMAFVRMMRSIGSEPDLSPVLAGLAVNGFTSMLGKAVRTDSVRVMFLAAMLLEQHFTEPMTAKMRTAVNLWAGIRANAEVHEVESLTLRRLNGNEQRDIENRWTVVAWGITHGHGAARRLTYLGKHFCPDCGREGHEAGCSCGWKAANVSGPEANEIERFDELTGPCGPLG